MRSGVIISFFILTTTTIGWGQTHFQPVAPTGLPYIVVVNAVELQQTITDTNAEIGIFDGALCVGAGMMADSGSTQITTWQGNSTQGLPGFQSGNPMFFNLWADSMEIVCDAEFITGNGTFGYNPYTVVNLAPALTAIVPENADFPPDFELTILSASPFNSRVVLDIRIPDSESGELTFFNLLGQVILRAAVNRSQRLVWDAKSATGEDLPSGIYLAVLQVAGETTTQRLVLLR